MATGFYVPDGRDFSSIFTAGNAGFTSGFKQANGQDLGNIFVGGNSGVATKYFNVNTDMGNKLGVTKSYSQVLFDTYEQVTKDYLWTINKTISKIEYLFWTNHGASLAITINDHTRLNTSMSKTGNETHLFLTINQYVTTLELLYYQDSEGYYPYIRYLKLYGTYIQ